jgi:hypothetical protein
MSQFASVYGSAVAETVATIGDSLEYGQRNYACVLGEESYSNQLTDGGFEAVREVSAMLNKADAPTFKMGQRCKINGRTYRIVAIDDDGKAIDLKLQSPDKP